MEQLKLENIFYFPVVLSLQSSPSALAAKLLKIVHISYIIR